MSLRIVVADDHVIVQEGLRALLSTVDGYQVVGVAVSGEEAVRAAVVERPDVVVMDIQMPGIGGVEATRRIGRAAPGVAVVVLTMFDDDESVFAVIRAGALGYVLKGAPPSTMIRAIAAVAGGEAIFSAGIARRALGYLAAPRHEEAPFPELTPREREVLELIAEGVSNTGIAARFGRPPAPSATTSPASSPSCRWRPAPRPSSGPTTRACEVGRTAQRGSVAAVLAHGPRRPGEDDA